MGNSAEALAREEKLQGIGTSRLRKEDARFIRGQAAMSTTSSCRACCFRGDRAQSLRPCQIKSIDKAKAWPCRAVVAVLVADDLKPVNLAWMPTLGGDVQAVLADKKVCFRCRKSPWSSQRPLCGRGWRGCGGSGVRGTAGHHRPAQVHGCRCADHPPDIADKTEVGHGPRTHPNHIFTWEAGDKAATDAVFAKAEVTVREEILNPRVHPCPLETCGCVASFHKPTGQLTVYMTSQAPHLVRTVLAMLSGIAESKIRVIGGDIGGGFGNKVADLPGLRRRHRGLES